MIDKKFGRGINLKFAVDCEVLVLINQDYIALPLIKQMVGRSSRRQGLCMGTVFAVNDYGLENKD
jgi:hypothetical protein